MSASPWHRRALCSIAIVLLMAAAGCGDDDGTPSATTAAPNGEGADVEVDLTQVSLRVGVTGSRGDVRKIAYDESGAFDDTAYQIEWIDFENGVATVEAMNAGAIDVAVTIQATSVMLAHGNARDPWTTETAPFVVVGASTAVDDPGFVVMVDAASGIGTLDDLVGKRVAYQRGGHGHYFFVHLWNHAGFSRDDFEEVNLPASEGRAAFAAGSVDALVASYRNVVGMVESGEVVVLSRSSDVVPGHFLHLARTGVLDDPAREAAIGDLLLRLEDANAWMLANVDAVGRIFEDHGGLAADEAVIAAQTYAARRVPFGDGFDRVLLDQSDVFVAEEIMARAVDLDVLLDRRFESARP